MTTTATDPLSTNFKIKISTVNLTSKIIKQKHVKLKFYVKNITVKFKPKSHKMKY